MTRREIGECTAILSASCGTEFDRDKMGIWHELLDHLPGESVMAACQRFALEGDGFPTVSKIAKLAGEHSQGGQPAHGDAWEGVLALVRRYGIYGRDDARMRIPRLVWRAIGGDVGWEHLCDMEPGQRATFAAQFRQRYQELRERERKRAALPERLLPRIDTRPVEEPEARPRIEHEPAESPSEPAPAIADYTAALAKETEATPRDYPSEDEIERRRQRQVAAAEAILERQR